MDRWQSRQQANNEVPWCLHAWQERTCGSHISGICRKGPAPRCRSKSSTPCAKHYFKDYKQVCEQGFWQNNLQGIAARRKGCNRCQVKRKVRCTTVGRAL